MPVCSNPNCKHNGVEQDQSQFRKKRRKCVSCLQEYYNTYYRENRATTHDRLEKIKDDDPEDDLVHRELGDGCWSRITR